MAVAVATEPQHCQQMTTGGMQVPTHVRIGGRYAILRQIRWCAAIQISRHCHCKLEEYPVGDTEPVKFIVQCPIQAVIELLSAVTTRAAAFNNHCTLCAFGRFCNQCMAFIAMATYVSCLLQNVSQCSCTDCMAGQLLTDDKFTSSQPSTDAELLHKLDTNPSVPKVQNTVPKFSSKSLHTCKI